MSFQNTLENMHLSYSSFTTWERNPVQWVKNYYAGIKGFAQTEPMALGSAFDAYIKHDIDPTVDHFKSCEKPHILPVGMDLFGKYKCTPEWQNLKKELDKALNKRMELDIRNTYEGMSLLGKPDLFYVNEQGDTVLLDWKVSGFYSVHPPKIYKDGPYMEDVNSDWASQLTVYSWLLGGAVWKIVHYVVPVNPSKPFEGLRVIEYRKKVKREYENYLLLRFQAYSASVRSGWFLKNCSTIEESQAECERIKYDALMGLQ